MNKINLEVLLNMLNKIKEKGSNQMLLHAMRAFIPCKSKTKDKNKVSKCLVIFVVTLIPSVYLGLSENTVTAMQQAAGTLLSTILSVFGIVFTGYVFFQALINKKLLISLINSVNDSTNPEEEECKLQETNEEFVSLMLLCVIMTALNLLVEICLNAFSNNFCLFNKDYLNSIMATILITLLLYMNTTVLWELKSFIYNIFQLFSMHAVTKVLEEIEEDRKDTH